MSAQGLPQVRTAIARGRLEAVYYVHGDDEYRKDALVRELVAAVVEPATRDFNHDTLRGGDATPERLESVLHTLPMMAARRLVVVRDVGALKKDARAVLDRYLTRPAADTVLLLVAAAGGKVDKELERRATVVAVPVLDEEAAQAWAVAHAREAHGATLTEPAAALLCRAVGPEAAALASEVDKLASYTMGGAIDEGAVGAVVGVRQGETTSDFLDRVAERDVAGALALLEHVLQQPKSGAVPLIMALTVQTLAIGWGRHARDRGLPASRLEAEFFGLLKETGAFPMRPWGEAVKCWARNVSRWDAASVRRGVAALLAADRAAKDTRVSSDAQVLATLVCALCAPAGAARA